MDEDKTKEEARKAVEWMASEEGSRSLREALEKVRIACEERRKASQVTWEQMNRPCTI